MHRIFRARLPHLVEGRRGRILCAAAIVAGALLLAVPIPLLPLTNTFPALGILLFALGWRDRDGLSLGPLFYRCDPGWGGASTSA